MKLTRGTWIHMNVAGHDPKELWQKFPNASGKGGYQAWTQGHVGEVIAMQNGEAVNIGPCKVCGGAATVECRGCKGQGTQLCDICRGQKFIPTAWTPSDNPWLNSQPDVIHLSDGRFFLGKVVVSSGEEWTIRLSEGKFIHVKATDILRTQTTPVGASN
jgi:hypothetical protein